LNNTIEKTFGQMPGSFLHSGLLSAEACDAGNSHSFRTSPYQEPRRNLRRRGDYFYRGKKGRQVVIKLTMSAGSQGVFICTTENEVRNAYLTNNRHLSQRD